MRDIGDDLKMLDYLGFDKIPKDELAAIRVAHPVTYACIERIMTRMNWAELRRSRYLEDLMDAQEVKKEMVRKWML